MEAWRDWYCSFIQWTTTLQQNCIIFLYLSLVWHTLATVPGMRIRWEGHLQCDCVCVYMCGQWCDVKSRRAISQCAFMSRRDSWWSDPNSHNTLLLFCSDVAGVKNLDIWFEQQRCIFVHAEVLLIRAVDYLKQGFTLLCYFSLLYIRYWW